MKIPEWWSHERHFPLTREGCLEAEQYLHEIGEWENVTSHGFSCDGWEITDTANRLWFENRK